jgi:hypothetical protein
MADDMIQPSSQWWLAATQYQIGLPKSQLRNVAVSPGVLQQMVVWPR